jgi:DNA-binding NtrC family response regulator
LLEICHIILRNVAYHCLLYLNLITNPELVYRSGSRRVPTIILRGIGMQQQNIHGAESLLGSSVAHKRVLSTLERVAATDAEILISGPTGSGKELYAIYLHQCSPRAKAPFIAVNCGGLPSDLLENELFGHVGGAFTGARPQSTGLVAEAEGGTLFLDEVNSLPLPAQAKLLRFLQSKEYRRLGETRLRRADLRIVAATNADLAGAIKQKTFRQDLFFRLRVVPVEVPALTERQEDIPLLLDEFAERYSRCYRMPRIVVGDRALARMLSYGWPGNIRELENCVKYLTCLGLRRPVDPYDLPLLEEEPDDTVCIAELARSGPLKQVKQELVEQLERTYLEEALRRSHGNIAAAARASCKPRRAFFELMRKYGVSAMLDDNVPPEQPAGQQQ